MKSISSSFGPDLTNGIFIAMAIRYCRTQVIGIIPALVRQTGRLPASRHFKMAVQVRLRQPVIGIAQPILAVLFTLFGKPANLIVSPYPKWAHSRVTRLFAGAVIIKFHHIRQAFAFPAAARDPPLTPSIKIIGLPNF